MHTIYVARQPIYDRRLNRIGYELLYRTGDVEAALVTSGQQASAQVIVNAFLNIGVDRLVGSGFAFINVPETLIVNDALLPMFHEQTVLEVSSEVPANKDVLAGLRHLKDRGFSIALDNFTGRADRRAMLDLADFVKLDALTLGRDELARELGAVGTKANTVALRVETPEKHAECLALGFEYFQGYFYCRPQTLQDRSVAPNRAVVLSLLNKLADPDLNLRDLESTLAGDVAVSYKLLRYANSAAFGLRREVTSLRDAIVLVGLNTIRNWASLILLDRVQSGKPPELIKTAMVRARTCDWIAVQRHAALRAQAFITGLLSVIDAIMDVPMARLLDDLSLSTPIKFALLSHEGELGRILREALLYEQGDWAALMGEGADLPLLRSAYQEAVKWADENVQALFG
jgi:EAL and modified HD-GYP domain-containing signal transduction protein